MTNLAQQLKQTSLQFRNEMPKPEWSKWGANLPFIFYFTSSYHGSIFPIPWFDPSHGSVSYLVTPQLNFNFSSFTNSQPLSFLHNLLNISTTYIYIYAKLQNWEFPCQNFNWGYNTQLINWNTLICLTNFNENLM